MVTTNITKQAEAYGSRTLTNFKFSNKAKNKWRSTKLPTIDTAYLTLYDYERIRQNAYLPTKEEELNEAKIKSEQEYDKNAKARALRDKIINYDKKNPKIELSDIDLENIEKRKMLLELAQKEIDNNEDVVKEMEKLSLYARVAHIREKQKKELIKKVKEVKIPPKKLQMF